MKTIGIIGAMESEIELLTKTVKCDIKEYAHTKFYVGEYGANKVVIACSGIGKVNSALTAQNMITTFGAEKIINTGIAGGLSANLGVGDVVVSSKLTYHDFTLRFLTYQYPNTEYFKADAELVNIAKAVCAEAGERVNVGEIVSGDTFVSDAETKNKIIAANPEALCVEMEGASIAHVCARNDIPFVVIRTLSDNADDNADFNFDKFEKETAEISAKTTLKIVENIK